MTSKFRNEALVDFSDGNNVKKMKEAIACVKEKFCERLPLVINGEKI